MFSAVMRAAIVGAFCLCFHGFAIQAPQLHLKLFDDGEIALAQGIVEDVDPFATEKALLELAAKKLDNVGLGFTAYQLRGVVVESEESLADFKGFLQKVAWDADAAGQVEAAAVSFKALDLANAVEGAAPDMKADAAAEFLKAVSKITEKFAEATGEANLAAAAAARKAAELAEAVKDAAPGSKTGALRAFFLEAAKAQDAYFPQDNSAAKAAIADVANFEAVDNVDHDPKAAAAQIAEEAKQAEEWAAIIKASLEKGAKDAEAAGRAEEAATSRKALELADAIKDAAPEKKADAVAEFLKGVLELTANFAEANGKWPLAAAAGARKAADLTDAVKDAAPGSKTDALKAFIREASNIRADEELEAKLEA